MRISISNLAWDPKDDSQVASLLKEYDVKCIDIAPSKYFANIEATSAKEIQSLKSWWNNQGISIYGMQSLFFHKPEFSIFGTNDNRKDVIMYFRHLCRIASGLGIEHLTFGSPKNRNRDGLTNEQVNEISLSFFSNLGTICQEHKLTLSLEPNPTYYKCNFMTTTQETAQIVKLVNHPNIRIQLDTGAMSINHEDPEKTVTGYKDFFGHIHLSEPDLVPLGDGSVDHAKVRTVLEKHLPTKIKTIEMLSAKSHPSVYSIKRALDTAKKYYDF